MLFESSMPEPKDYDFFQRFSELGAFPLFPRRKGGFSSARDAHVKPAFTSSLRDPS